MAKRKTIDVLFLLDKVNDRNRLSTCPADIREGWNSLLEEVLHSTGNYAGFGYLSANDVPEGEKPGISHDGDFTPRFPDETRRVYYTSPSLIKTRLRNYKRERN
jgi:hypothetical protein